MAWKSSKTTWYQSVSVWSTLRMYHSRARAFAASGSSLISYTVVSMIRGITCSLGGLPGGPPGDDAFHIALGFIPACAGPPRW